MKKLCTFIAFITCISLILIQPSFTQKLPNQDYLVYVLSEAADKISLIRFGTAGIKVEIERDCRS